MTLLEAIAAILTLANIALVVRRSVWNFPMALLAVTLTAIVLWESKLYSDAGLQGFFFALNLYGWWAWRDTIADAGSVVVERLGQTAFALWLVGSAAAVAAWGTLMAWQTDASFPWLDAAVAMLSVAGQILLVQRRLENWYWWIAVNLISIGLYAAKGLYWFTALYVLLLVMAARGFFEWRSSLDIARNGPIEAR